MDLRGYGVISLVLLLATPIRNDDKTSIELGLYANRVVSYGVPTPLVVTMSAFPKCELMLKVSSHTYLVAEWIVGPKITPMKPLFRQTYKISKELKRLNIVASVRVSYQLGYFAELNATFWQQSNIKLTFTGFCRSKSQSGMSPAAKTIHLIMDTSSYYCIPYMETAACFDPSTPLDFSMEYGFMIELYLITSCGMDIKNLTWTVMDLTETKILKTFRYKSLVLNVDPYDLRFPTESGPNRNRYVIQISGHFDRSKFVVRCYIKALAEKVQAIIKGGILKHVHQDEEIYMDGSASRDYAKQPNEKQFNVYMWTCTSNDVHNPMCNGRTWTQAAFQIPGKTFAVGNKYEFTLTVVSDIYTDQKSQAKQILSIVSFKTLQVEIVCVKNCESNIYDPKDEVLLSVQCHNCGSYQPKYAWYLDGYVASQSKYLRMRLRTNNEVATVVLGALTADYRRGGMVSRLLQRDAPFGGHCKLSPSWGYELKVKFKACCYKFIPSRNLRYFFYADQVLLNQCANCNNCYMYLPKYIEKVTALVCSMPFVCTQAYIRVRVKSLGKIPMKTPKEFWTFLTTPPIAFDVKDRLRFIAIAQMVANEVRTSQIASTLMNAFKEFRPQTVLELSMLANFTKTLAINLSPIDTDAAVVLTHSLTKLNENFQYLTDISIAHRLIRYPYVNTTLNLFTVNNIMDVITRQMAAPSQFIFDKYNQALQEKCLNQSVIDQLLNKTSQIENEKLRNRSETWVNLMWQTERLYRFLSHAREHISGSNETIGVNVAGVTLQVNCLNVEPGKNYVFETHDLMHKVYLWDKLLKEIMNPNTKRVCIKIISAIRELNWWYPEEKQPSKVLLSVRLYTEENKYVKELKLHHSNISFRTSIGKYRPAVGFGQRDGSIMKRISRAEDEKATDDLDIDDSENYKPAAESGRYDNCVEYGHVHTKMHLLAYRMRLSEMSMVVVRFKNTTHRLRVLMALGTIPIDLVSDIAKSKCSVPAGSINTTIILRNRCKDPQRVYLIVRFYGDDELDGPVPDGPANFSFVFQVRSCDYWPYSGPKDSQSWSPSGCLPSLNYPKYGYMFCDCDIMGTYTSYVYYVPAIVVPLNISKDTEFNWTVLAIYLAVLLTMFTVLVLLFIWHNKRPSKTIACDMTGLEGVSDQDVHDLLIYLRTGGCINSLTTATVRLIFETTKRAELQFTLMQNPESPELTRNSTYILWLRTRDIRIPTRIAVVHNNEGRYPSWYLRSIEVIDIQAQQMQVFKVNRWVRHKFLILSSSMVVRPGEEGVVDRWRDRFVSEFERQWINWGLFQPLTGKWRGAGITDSMTRAQRVCIFLNKVIITYTVCACVFAPAKKDSVDADNIYFNYRSFLIMLTISLVLTNLVQYILEKLVAISRVR